jgi:hypothetical protein
MGLADTELELRAWLDRLAIQDLIYRYSDAVTRADWEQCEATFAADAVWESPKLGMRFDSGTAFVQMLAGSSTSELLIQTPHAPVIKLIGSGKAQATTTIHEWIRGIGRVDNVDHQKGDVMNLEQYGVYYDDIARIDGEWKFAHRLFVPIYVGSGCVTGDVVTPRSGLLRPE